MNSSGDRLTEWQEDILVQLSLQDPSRSIPEGPEWYDDANPEPYLDLVDRDLIVGITYSHDSDGGTEVQVSSIVRLTEEGERLASSLRRRRLQAMHSAGSRVFLSYVREDVHAVTRLSSDLATAGITVWRDVDFLLPGDRWKEIIQHAIRDGAGFVACFSSASEARDRSYMRDELLTAIDELRMRPADQGWLIPVQLSECEIPRLPIGGGQTLADIHFIELHSDWSIGIDRLTRAIERLV